ncbi:hypothetical protein QJS66_09795 [Kocuria rhizophila]|nr:hypothetical protein QJS66_09795 [Kocuria rhizophila]
MDSHRLPRTSDRAALTVLSAVGLAAAADGRGGHAVPVPTAAGGLPGTGHRVGGPPPVLARWSLIPRPRAATGNSAYRLAEVLGPVHRSAGRDGAAQRFGGVPWSCWWTTSWTACSLTVAAQQLRLAVLRPCCRSCSRHRPAV